MLCYTENIPIVHIGITPETFVPRCIDAGINTIIGTGPHKLQEIKGYHSNFAV